MMSEYYYSYYLLPQHHDVVAEASEASLKLLGNIEVQYRLSLKLKYNS